MLLLVRPALAVPFHTFSLSDTHTPGKQREGEEFGRALIKTYKREACVYLQLGLQGGVSLTKNPTGGSTMEKQKQQMSNSGNQEQGDRKVGLLTLQPLRELVAQRFGLHFHRQI